MQFCRPLIAAHPMRFGRGRAWLLEAVSVANGISEDIKLFATTFAIGFLFVSILIG